jgi:hypothetical protein
VIGSIGELPFVERAPRDVLHLDQDRAAPDPDYAGFGFCRVASIGLEDPAGGVRILDDVLVLALHSADAGEPHHDDVELEFVLDPTEPSVIVLLSTFLARWLPRLPSAPVVVLAMCNPHRATLGRPAGLAGGPLHYAIGDVESWRDLDGAPELRLRADSWRVAE